MSSMKHTAAKTIGYRVISWASTTTLAWLIIGSTLSASGNVDGEAIAKATLIFSAVDMIANTALYFFYERAWIAYPRLKKRMAVTKLAFNGKNAGKLL